MLSPETLNRVSSSYRRGYYDGYEMAPFANLPCETYLGMPMKPFTDYDYSQGYAAGLNDRYWSDHDGKRVTMPRKEFMAKYIPEGVKIW